MTGEKRVDKFTRGQRASDDAGTSARSVACPDADLTRIDAKEPAGSPAHPGSDLLLEDVSHVSYSAQGRPPCALGVRGLSASYDGRQVLRGVSLDITPGRITAILGPSGCGKSTFLRCLNGMLADEPGTRMEGQVLLAGADAGRLQPEELRRRVGLVFQTPSPFPFSIQRNIEYVLKYYGYAPRRDKAGLASLVRAHLEQVGLYAEVADDLKRSALKLSGGQQQRLCIARALAARPDALLLDEPCSALDVRSTAVIEDLLRKLKLDYTIVIVTHNVAQARRVADDVAVLLDGGVAEAGPAAEVLACPKDKRVRDFLRGN